MKNVAKARAKVKECDEGDKTTRRKKVGGREVEASRGTRGERRRVLGARVQKRPKDG